MSTRVIRNYEAVAESLKSLGNAAPREVRMQRAVDALWPALAPADVSWLGFYVIAHHPERGHEMLLGPRRDKPACSPIGMHGACGRCFTSARPLIVTDVAKLGAGYIACDPRDRSEVVVPLFDDAGAAWGVLDLDSYGVSEFAESDVVGLQRVLEAARLTPARDWTGRIEVV